MKAYKSWRWDHTDWHSGKFKAIPGRTLTAPDWRPDMGANHCGNGFHSHAKPEGCFDFVHLGPISEVEILGAYECGDKIRSEKIKVFRWLTDAELAEAARVRWGADHSEVIPRMRSICRRSPLRAERTTERQQISLANWASVRASVRASVWASVGDNVGDSVWDSVGAVAGYVCVPLVAKWSENYPCQACVDLWLSGCVPSFDGNVWRLHGKGGKEIYRLQK